MNKTCSAVLSHVAGVEDARREVAAHYGVTLPTPPPIGDLLIADGDIRTAVKRGAQERIHNNVDRALKWIADVQVAFIEPAHVGCPDEATRFVGEVAQLVSERLEEAGMRAAMVLWDESLGSAKLLTQLEKQLYRWSTTSYPYDIWGWDPRRVVEAMEALVSTLRPLSDAQETYLTRSGKKREPSVNRSRLIVGLGEIVEPFVKRAPCTHYSPALGVSLFQLALGLADPPEDSASRETHYLENIASARARLRNKPHLNPDQI